MVTSQRNANEEDSEEQDDQDWLMMTRNKIEKTLLDKQQGGSITM